MRRFDKKKIIREANLRLEQEFVFEKMLMTEIGEAAPYTISYDDDGYRNVRYEIKTEQYGLVTMELTISKYFKSDFNRLEYRFDRVGIEEMDDKDYCIGISFGVKKTEKSNINTYGTINSQAAQIMATNTKATSEFINEMAAKDYRLIMVFSSPVEDNNDKARERAIDTLKGYVSNNRPVSEREVRNYVKIQKLLDYYYEIIFRAILIDGEYRPKMTGDESEKYENNTQTFINNLNIAGSKKGILLCLYDKQYNLDNLLKQAKREAATQTQEGDNEDIINIKTYFSVLRFLRDKIDSTDVDYIQNLVANAPVSSTALPADESSMRERLYNKYFDEQIASNSLLKNFVKFKKGGEIGIYDYLKTVGEEKPVKTNAEIDADITNALNAQKLIIKIGEQSSLYDLNSENSRLISVLNSLKRNRPSLNHLLSTIGNSIEIKDIDRNVAESIVREIRAALNSDFNNGQDHVEITYGGQPFDVPNN
jgi:hypothetical protein